MTSPGDSHELERLEREFHRMLDLETAERAGYVEVLALESPGLARKLESLLAAHERPAFVDETPLGGRLIASLDLKPGDELHGYVLEELIGSGGMGTVWRARQQSPRRPVALKLLRSGQVEGTARRRFAREADIMGALQHPGIARIYEVGECESPAGPVPFYAMELIDGVPLDQHADQAKLDTRRRIELVIAVCDAVAHANARGIVHRDLKPANVLVTRDGHPKVLDFGVARLDGAHATGVTLLTSAGQLIGTIAYMSPEQTAGWPDSIDQRADVYSLGVILYELVSGRRPLALSGRPPLEALRMIREDEPAPLGAIDSAWRGDLSVITMKALEKEPERRYAGAVDLADDLRSHLADRTIRARPPGAIYRIRKFTRRNRVAVIAAGVVVISLVTGLVMALGAKREAEHATREAQRALKRYQGILGFLDETLAAVDPTASGRRHVTLESFVDEVARGLELRFPEDEEAKVVLETTVGRAYAGIERFDDARRHLTAALESRRRNLSPDDPLIAESHFQLARNDASAREIESAAGHVREALGILEARGTSNGDLSVRCHELAGFIGFLSSEYELARDHLDLARDPSGDQTWYATWIAAKIDIVEGRYERGIEGMKRTASTAARDHGHDHPRVAELVFELAECQLNAELVGEAEKTARRALDLIESRFGSPFAVIFRNHGILGRILMEMGRLEEAEAHLRTVLARQDELEQPESFTTSTRLTLGSILLRRGRKDEARAMITAATGSLRDSYPDGHHVLASALLLSAREAMSRAEPLDAIELAAEAWAMGKRYPVADIDLRAGAELARLHRALAETDEAVAVMQDVSASAVARHGRTSEASMPFQVLLGAFLFDAARTEEAVDALSIVDDLAALESPKHGFSVAMGRRSLGGALLDLGDLERAESHLVAAFDLSESAGPAGRRIFLDTGRMLLELYDELEDGKKKAAIRRRMNGLPPTDR